MNKRLPILSKLYTSPLVIILIQPLRLFLKMGVTSRRSPNVLCKNCRNMYPSPCNDYFRLLRLDWPSWTKRGSHQFIQKSHHVPAMAPGNQRHATVIAFNTVRIANVNNTRIYARCRKRFKHIIFI